MNNIFVLLVLFQLKHFICDYPLQGKYMLGKFKDGWDWVAPLLSHVAVHGWFTGLIVAFFKPELIVPLVLLDMMLHFIMDRIKASPNLLGRFKSLSANEFKTVFPPRNTQEENVLKGNTYFWWSLGLDQGVHHLTHYLIIWCLL